MIIIPIGIIDSGLGAISVLNHLINQKKYSDYILFLDYQFNPFGEKEETILLKRLKIGVEFLKKQGCTRIIIACNTLSVIALKYNFKDVITPIFYFQEVIKEKYDQTSCIITTKFTKNSLIYGKNCHNASELVSYIEGNNPLNIENYLKKYKNYKRIFLGCTHFNLLIKNGDILDSGKILAEHILVEKGHLNITIYVTKLNKNIYNHLIHHLHLGSLKIINKEKLT